MWTALGTNLATAVINNLLPKNTPEITQRQGSTSIDGNYSLRGHINNVPVDLRIEKGCQSSAGSIYTPTTVNRYESFQQSQIVSRIPANNSQTISRPFSRQSSCNSCSSASSNRPAPKKIQQDNSGKKQNGDNGKYCKIIIPQEGNYEINIKKIESNFANMTVSNSAQNKQKNIPRQKPQNGNQNKPNGNQNRAGKFQNDRPVKYQTPNNPKSGGGSKDRNDKKVDRKPGDLKVVKNNSGNQNKPKFGGQNNNQRSNSSYNSYTWMYLGRLKLGTTEIEIRNYLQQKFPGHDFLVEKLPLYKDAKLPCFKVKVDNRILDNFQNLDNWPMGVTITKYINNFKS